MQAETSGGVFAPQHKWDRNFFLAMAALAWLGILMGFGGDIAYHITKHQPPFPLIVHFHAVVFVSWLVLFTAQIVLIRVNKWHIHRKLGLGMIGLAVVMVFLGPATALTVQHMNMTKPDADPAFLSIQFTDILAFAGLVTAAVLLRKQASAHKRLILLATLYITDAGFARWTGGAMGHVFGFGFWGALMVLYTFSDLLILSVGAYDLITRHRLHPAYIAGVAWVVVCELLATGLYHWPAWLSFAKSLIAAW